MTPAFGAWERGGRKSFTFSLVGFDRWDPWGGSLGGNALRLSGTGRFSDCDLIHFDWVLDEFPGVSDPLVDAPQRCSSGNGTMRRVTVALGSCPDYFE